MPDLYARPTHRVDEQLATLVTLQRDTLDQLDSVRRQMVELQSHELSLVTAYGGRERRIDGLLDERLLSVRADRIVSA